MVKCKLNFLKKIFKLINSLIQSLFFMKKSSFFIFPVLFISVFSITSCDKSPSIGNEEELITTMNYTLTPVGGGASVLLSFKDLDGDGGSNPIVVSDTLAANTTYQGVLTLYNESVSPSENISEEIENEGTVHQFFFQNTASGVTTSYADVDTDGKPVGLLTTLSTTNAGTGTLKITLRHEPDKAATGVAAGDIANAGGETDIEVTFDVVIQ